MLEPQAENPRLLLEHHKRRAQLAYEAGDNRAAYWHGRMAQKARKDVQRLDHVDCLRRGRDSSEAAFLALKREVAK